MALPALAGCGGEEYGGGPLPGGPTAARSPGKDAGGGAARPMTGPPLRFLPVATVTQGACAGDAGFTLGSGSDASCLGTVEQGGMRVTQLKSAKAAYDPGSTQGGWRIEIELGSRDAAAFAQLTRELSTRTAPGNQLAIVRGERALSAPAVLSAITGGKMQISGGFNRSEAERLAHDLAGA
ncbi:hypothetical protein ACZ90_31345 [Streptomyces albus subsp. albus]|nr:hypothetical protein ACZ90_31345 [Streptomyces albus subsp. albus]